MSANIANQFTVFTKAWPEKALLELAEFIKALGFDGVELPVRSGYQVTAENMAEDLPKAARIFADRGVKIGSVAGTVNEAMIRACGEAGIPILRIMARVDRHRRYQSTEDGFRREFDAVLPLLEEYGVTIGVQNHAADFIGSAIGIMHLIEQYDPKHVGVVLDPAHCALAGEPAAIAIDIAWSHLLLLNLKNGYWKQIGRSETDEARWKNYWTSSKEGLLSWQEVVQQLKQRNYQRDICVTAEYSAPKNDPSLLVEDLVKKDFAYLKSLF